MTSLRVAVTEASQVSEARRLATTFAQDLGFSAAKLGKLALAVTEVATNLVKHATRGGEILVQVVAGTKDVGIDILSLDRGPGITNITKALADGYSTASSAGTGLGSVRRQSDFFDIYSQPEIGTGLIARLWSGKLPEERKRAGLEVGGVCVPGPGEQVSGDGWAVEEFGGRTLVVLVDGLGHGIGANEAATEALAAFRRNLESAPVDLMRSIHSALRSTRGGVAAVAEVSEARDSLGFVGTGNIGGILVQPGGNRSMVSQPGTVGQELRKVQQFDYPWSRDALLILHTDGLTSRVDLRNHPGLEGRAPALIAGFLYSQYGRGRDDATVVVVKEALR